MSSSSKVAERRPMRHRLIIAALIVVIIYVVGAEVVICAAAADDVEQLYSINTNFDEYASRSEEAADTGRNGNIYGWNFMYKYSAITRGRRILMNGILRDGQEKSKIIETSSRSRPIPESTSMKDEEDEYKMMMMGHVQMLIQRDRHRHASRALLETNNDAAAPYSFAPANETQRYDSLGGLHYTSVTLASPATSFLVAIDTGSDLLWVPCDCQQCAPTDWTNYLGQSAQDQKFAVYSPSDSNSSAIVQCDDEMCPSVVSNCTTNSNSQCTYVVNYMATDTSTSGVIVQDLLYLNSETAGINGSSSAAAAGATTTTPIYFGCAKLQTGDLLQGVAPNGLLGLGPNDVSVPNTLARNGIVSNSFSLCFSASDTSGRLVFGTQAKAGVRNTSLVPSNIYYIVTPSTMTVGGDSTLTTSRQLIFDTGTSYTTLPNSVFANLGTLFSQKITLPRVQFTNQLFSYCWRVSDSNDVASLPNMSITFSGGSVWDIVDPYEYVFDSSGNIGAACLAILNGTSTGIIGYNFMPGYEYFLNQEYMTFSWAPSDCYNLNQSTVGTKQSTITTKVSNTNAAPQSLWSSNLSTQVLTIASILLTTFSFILSF